MSLRRKSILSAIAALVLTGSRFALAALVARKLSPNQFGAFVYTQWLVDISFLACSLGCTGAASRYFAEFRNDAGRLKAFFSGWLPYVLSLPFLAAAIVILGAWASNIALTLPLVLSLSIWSLANSFLAMQTAALSGLQRFDLILISNCIAAAAMVGGAFFLPIDIFGLELLLGCMALSCFLAFLPGVKQFFLIQKNQSFASIDHGLIKSVKKYAINMWLIALLWALVWSRGEVTVVRYFLGDAGVADYAAALTLFNGAIQGVMLGMTAVAPQLTTMLASGERDKALLLAKKVMDIQLLVCGFATVSLICLSPELLSFVFGDHYKVQFLTLSILSLGLFSLSLANQNHILQIMTDGVYSRNVAIAGLVLLFVFSTFFVSKFGVQGAALSRAATLLFSGFISILFFYKSWGGRGLSLKSGAIVFCLNFVAFFLIFFQGESGLAFRVGILFVASLFLLIALPVFDGKGVFAFLLSKKRFSANE